MRSLQAPKSTSTVRASRSSLRVRAQAPEATVTTSGNVVTEAGELSNCFVVFACMNSLCMRVPFSSARIRSLM